MHQPLQPRSVPAAPSGFTSQGDATFSASVPLKHTQTVPALPLEASNYFANHDVPNHQRQQAPMNAIQGVAATLMDVDANNGTPSEFDKGKGKKKDNSE